ncbi:MAG: outer membrane protein transport protein [Proteobacteria bacterium]|nr:outer membrane protein transport protein [Pseudomonadota bacterium]
MLGTAVLASGPAMGAGFGLKEHSADAMAAAYAGAAATDRDASYLAYNPAALAGVDSTDLSLSLVPILSGSNAHYSAATTSASTATGGGMDPRGFISDAQVPAFAIRHRLNNRVAVGLNVTAPWGLRTEYPASWGGRYYALQTKLLTINFAPSISYQISPNLALGASMQIEFAQGTLSSVIDTGTLGALNSIPGSVPGAQDSIARANGNNWAYGFGAGAIYRPADGVSLGLAYRSSLQHNLRGPLTFTLDSAGIGATIQSLTGLFTDTKHTTRVTMPDTVTSGARFDLSSQWSAMLEVDWTHWSRFRDIVVTADNPAQPTDLTTTHWHDGWFGSVGAEYRPSARWAIRAGAAYDGSPVPDGTREPRIPDSDRIWLSAGVRYRMSRSIDLNVTASRLFFLESNIALTPAITGAALRGSLSGTTNAYVNVAGIELSWHAN